MELMEKNLKCQCCKLDISLSDDEWNRHRTFWRNNTNILKRSFICDSCLSRIRSGDLFKQHETTENIPSQFVQTITTIWKEYYSFYSQDKITLQVINDFKQKITTFLKSQNAENACKLIFSTDERIIDNRNKLVFPKTLKLEVTLPFTESVIAVNIENDTTYFE